MKLIDIIATILVIVGALNWGLYGAFNLDVIARFLGQMTTAARVLYVLIGISGLYWLFFCRCVHHRWCRP